MKPSVRPLAHFLLAVLVIVAVAPRTSHAYSVLSHEEVVDMAWQTTIVPMLKHRFPGITDDQILQAHAYAYGGSIIQDIGYYPFGSHFFSNLLHYVRPDVFVENLIRDSKTPNDYAFALGALAHYCGDTVGHPYINQVTAKENPKLRSRFGKVVTYDENPTAHVRTEFGFDVVEVAHGHYSQQNYHDFIGFQVAKPLLEQAFLETYGLKVSDVITHEDLAIGTYRHAVSGLIPEMTKLAFVTYRDQIEKAAPGTAKSTFLYRLNRTEYAKEFGTDYTHVGFWGRFVAFVLRVVPKIGPFKALKVSIPSPEEQDLYLKSVNASVDQFKAYLGLIRASPAPLPPPDTKDVYAAQTAAAKLQLAAVKSSKQAAKTSDPDEKAARERAANNVAIAAQKATEAAQRTSAKVEEAQATGVVPRAPGALPPDAPIRPPVPPDLPDLDMDTGKPAHAGEYPLADQTYAGLLNDLVKPQAPMTLVKAVDEQDAKASKASDAPLGSPAPKPIAPARLIEAALAASIEHFFAHPEPERTPFSQKEEQKELKLVSQVKSNLEKLKAMTAPSALTAAFGPVTQKAKGN
jgi:hypothetical protein